MIVYRHEVKYYISKQSAFSLSKVLGECMLVDKNSSENNTYYIRSLYFDTIDNKSYYEKVHGYSNRTKIRLRLYDTGSDFVKLEMKNKHDNYSYKESLSISREDALKLIKGDKDYLLGYKNKIADKAFILMHNQIHIPKIMIDYDREAYTIPFENIRITIDKNVRANSYSKDIFDKNICMTPVFTEDIYILEIKYDHMIPRFILDFLTNYVLEKSAISKYCLSRELLY